jgi:hypothetical protein
MFHITYPFLYGHDDHFQTNLMGFNFSFMWSTDFKLPIQTQIQFSSNLNCIPINNSNANLLCFILMKYADICIVLLSVATVLEYCKVWKPGSMLCCCSQIKYRCKCQYKVRPWNISYLNRVVVTGKTTRTHVQIDWKWLVRGENTVTHA